MPTITGDDIICHGVVSGRPEKVDPVASVSHSIFTGHIRTDKIVLHQVVIGLTVKQEVNSISGIS